MGSNKEKILGGIQRYSTEDGPGIRTTVFLKGCPLACKWCHNPELISSNINILYSKRKCIQCGDCIKKCPNGAITLANEGINLDREKCIRCGACAEICCSGALQKAGEKKSLEELIDILERDKEFYDRTGGGVTLSGGEILSQASYAKDIAKACISRGIRIALDTSGFGKWEDLESLAGLADIILFDIKQMDEEVHKELTGVGLDVIHGNLKNLAAEPELREKIIIRLPMINGINDQVEVAEKVSEFMVELGLKRANIIPYHNMGSSKYKELGFTMEEYETPKDEWLLKIEKIYSDKGIAISTMGRE